MIKYKKMQSPSGIIVDSPLHLGKRTILYTRETEDNCSFYRILKGYEDKFVVLRIPCKVENGLVKPDYVKEQQIRQAFHEVGIESIKDLENKETLTELESFVLENKKYCTPRYRPIKYVGAKGFVCPNFSGTASLQIYDRAFDGFTA